MNRALAMCKFTHKFLRYHMYKRHVGITPVCRLHKIQVYSLRRYDSFHCLHKLNKSGILLCKPRDYL